MNPLANFFRPLSTDRGGLIFLAILAVVAVVVPMLHLATSDASALHLSSYTVTLLGKYMCYALLAISVDLVWGYCGILSLGHGAFFALGGYAMGMHLMRQIGTRGVYGDPILPDFMVFLNWKELPWFWLARIPFARNGRVSLHHYSGAHLCVDASFLPQRYGLWRQQWLY
jgi:urea transport system permease protein